MKHLLVALLAFAPLAAQDAEPERRLREAASVFSEIMAATDTSIPQALLTDAHCIVIVPGLKTAAFVFGAKYGKGYLMCRRPAGAGWSAPGTVRIEGGSVGFQIGGSSTDLILLVMNERGADKLLSSKFTLGAEASVAGGPVGRTGAAQTDAQMKAEILSWSRSQGLFAGVSLAGATLRQDLDDNETLYGRRLENREIVTQGVGAPAAAADLIGLLNRHSQREGHGAVSAADRDRANNPRPSPTASYPAGKHKSPEAREVLQRAQAALNAKGFDAGPVDGAMGPRTRSAIQRFQKSESLPVTGRLDAETAKRLGVEETSVAGSFSNAGHEAAEGGRALGHEMKQGKPVAAGKELGKGIGRAAQQVGSGVVEAVNPDSDRNDRGDREAQLKQAERERQEPPRDQ